MSAGASLGTRFVWLLTGLVWASRSLLEFADPDYWNAVTVLDFAAVWLFTACWLTLAPSIVMLGRLVPTRPARVAAIVVAGAALLAGVANGIEDGFLVKSWGTFYVLGSMTAWLGLVALVVTFARAGMPRLGSVPGALFVGFLLFNIGGGLVILGALGAIAARPAWFLIADPPLLPDGGAGA